MKGVPPYDLSEVIKQFLENKVETRQELRRYLNEAMTGNPTLIRLLKNIVEETVDQGMKPIDVVGFTLLTGFMVGIYMERELQERRRIVP